METRRPILEFNIGRGEFLKAGFPSFGITLFLFDHAR
jgi:hypothetical protein